LTPNFQTAVVYVVSPDRGEQLLRSLDSLLRSRSQFELVRICCVGRPPGHWRFADSRIRVETVAPLFGRYFYGNKLHLCDTPARRVVFLDADTLVLRSLGTLWKNRGASFLARRGSAMARSTWNQPVWHELFAGAGTKEIPMFNAGVLVFQGGSHARLKGRWKALLLRFLAGDLPAPYHDRRMMEQWSLALAVAQEGISFGELGPESHAFGWQADSAVGATVFHYGHRHFDELAALFPGDSSPAPESGQSWPLFRRRPPPGPRAGKK
jgi:hypothetical protein